MERLASAPGFLGALVLDVALATLIGPALASAESGATATLPDSAGTAVLSDHFDDSLLSRLTPASTGDSTRTPIGGGWRHEFDIVLTRDGNGYAVYDADATRRNFQPRAREATTFHGIHSGDGWLESNGPLTNWLRPDGNVIVFRGSVPIRMDHPDSTSTHLRYETGRLIGIQRPDGRVQHLHYRNDRLFRISEPGHGDLQIRSQDNGSLRLDRRSAAEIGALGVDGDECRAETEPVSNGEPTPDAEQSCDTDSNPSPTTFALESSVPGAIRVDARPASCNSYFIDFHGTGRGTAIERGLNGLPHYTAYAPTVRSFPIVDFIGPELRVIRSRDLASPTYNGAGDALLERLLRDGDDVQRLLLHPLERDGTISVTELGATTILTHEPDRPIVLELLIRHGLASAAQQDQIRRARVALRERHGIELRVIEIP